MSTHCFWIPGQPKGYVAIGRAHWSKRAKAYHEYCARVRIYAQDADIYAPLQSSADNPIHISVQAVYERRSGRKADPGNVQKGICDALFWAPKGQKKGDDFWTSGSFNHPKFTDDGNPGVYVVVSVKDSND